MIQGLITLGIRCLSVNLVTKTVIPLGPGQWLDLSVNQLVIETAAVTLGTLSMAMSINQDLGTGQ